MLETTKLSRAIVAALLKSSISIVHCVGFWPHALGGDLVAPSLCQGCYRTLRPPLISAFISSGPNSARSSRKARRGPLDRSGSPVRGDDSASIDLAAVEQLIRLAHPLQWKMFDQHADFSRLGEADHFHEFGYGAPVGLCDGTPVRRAIEVYWQ